MSACPSRRGKRRIVSRFTERPIGDFSDRLWPGPRDAALRVLARAAGVSFTTLNKRVPEAEQNLLALPWSPIDLGEVDVAGASHLPNALGAALLAGINRDGEAAEAHGALALVVEMSLRLNLLVRDGEIDPDSTMSRVVQWVAEVDDALCDLYAVQRLAERDAVASSLRPKVAAVFAKWRAIDDVAFRSACDEAALMLTEEFTLRGIEWERDATLEALRTLTPCDLRSHDGIQHFASFIAAKSVGRSAPTLEAFRAAALVKQPGVACTSDVAPDAPLDTVSFCSADADSACDDAALQLIRLYWNHVQENIIAAPPGRFLQ